MVCLSMKSVNKQASYLQLIGLSYEWKITKTFRRCSNSFATLNISQTAGIFFPTTRGLCVSVNKWMWDPSPPPSICAAFYLVVVCLIRFIYSTDGAPIAWRFSNNRATSDSPFLVRIAGLSSFHLRIRHSGPASALLRADQRLCDWCVASKFISKSPFCFVSGFRNQKRSCPRSTTVTERRGF